MYTKAYGKQTWMILFLFIGQCFCAVSISQSNMITNKGGIINLVATTDEAGVTWTYKGGTSLTICSTGSAACIPTSILEMNFSANSSSATIAIASLNCSIHSGTYIASTTLDMASLTIDVTTPVSSISSKTSLTTSKVSSQELLVEVQCVYPKSAIAANFTVHRTGKPVDILIPDSKEPNTSYSGCECFEETYIVKKTITASQYPNEVVTIKANVGQLPTLDIGDVHFTSGADTDSCKCEYWICIIIIIVVVFIVCAAVTIVLVALKRNIAQEIISACAKKIICCWADDFICFCAKKIMCCGTSKILRGNLFFIGIPAIIAWGVSMLIVIYSCCTECDVKLKVLGISLVLSLVVICAVILLYMLLVTAFCKDREYRFLTVSSGEDILLLNDVECDSTISCVVWKHEGKVIDTRINGQVPLSLDRVSLDQSGKYECIVQRNDQETVYELKLRVTEKLYKVKIRKKVQLLKCLDSLSDIGNVEWRHNSRYIDVKEPFHKDGNKSNPGLTINCISTGDRGSYECYVTTNEILKRFSARIEIKEKKNNSRSLRSLKTPRSIEPSVDTSNEA